eukprot:276856_1
MYGRGPPPQDEFYGHDSRPTTTSYAQGSRPTATLNAQGLETAEGFYAHGNPNSIGFYGHRQASSSANVHANRAKTCDDFGSMSVNSNKPTASSCRDSFNENTDPNAFTKEC